MKARQAGFAMRYLENVFIASKGSRKEISWRVKRAFPLEGDVAERFPRLPPEDLAQRGVRDEHPVPVCLASSIRSATFTASPITAIFSMLAIPIVPITTGVMDPIRAELPPVHRLKVGFSESTSQSISSPADGPVTGSGLVVPRAMIRPRCSR
jgi:hypothetical protein